MSFEWLEYLDLARELAGQPAKRAHEEARLRAAISRAYYAIFCKCRNHLRDKEGHRIPPGGKAHQYVRNNFKKSADKRRKRIGYDLTRLRSDRNRADYDDSVAMLDALTKTDLALADRIIVRLSKL
jgi:uncharacterized protein (UPF0332 family)